MLKNKLVIALAVAYVLVLFIGLTMWRMPAERLIPYYAEKYSKGRLLLKVERASISFPLGCNLEKVSYAVSGGENPVADSLEHLIIRVNPLGWLRASLPVSFRAHPPGVGAIIQGRSSIPAAGKNTSIEIQASNVELGEMRVFKSLSSRDLKGKAGGQMSLSGNLADLSTLTGRGNILVQKGSVDTRFDLAGLKNIPFEVVRIPFTVKEGQLLLEKAEMEGPMLSGTLAGPIKLNKVFGNSTLDLTAKLRPGPLLHQNPMAGVLLSRIKEGSKEIVLKIGGSIKNPTVGEK